MVKRILLWSLLQSSVCEDIRLLMCSAGACPRLAHTYLAAVDEYNPQHSG